MKTYFALLFIFSFNAFASDLCVRVDSGIENYLLSDSSRIGFENRGGLINGGVCWWHSRLQRASAFLTEFSPDLPRPTRAEAKIIFQSIKRMDRIVTIPGFEDFRSFSTAYISEAQAVLEAWQIEDGFINQEWMRGISGRSKLSPSAMKELMDTLYDQYKKSPKPLWVMAQIKGLTAHAFLILEMIDLGFGYELKMIDSNNPSETKRYKYKDGDQALKYPANNYSFVPYLGFQKDMVAIKRVVESKCGNILGIDDYIPMGEVELK